MKVVDLLIRVGCQPTDEISHPLTDMVFILLMVLVVSLLKRLVFSILVSLVVSLLMKVVDLLMRVGCRPTDEVVFQPTVEAGCQPL